jgi:hypothetical protein
MELIGQQNTMFDVEDSHLHTHKLCYVDSKGKQ